MGLLVHYITGLSLGAIFGVAMSHPNAARVHSTKMSAGLGIVYTEFISLPLLATAPIILKMTAEDAAGWLGISFIMHMVYGAVLGTVVRIGLRAAKRAGSNRPARRMAVGL